jgi:rRNA maturation RNase YbeY
VSQHLIVRNRQRIRAVNSRLLCRMARVLIDEFSSTGSKMFARPGEDFELGIYLVTTQQMSRLNERFLQHWGPTDVLAFNYCEVGAFQGELFICLDEAVRQARRFGTRWEAELVRYLIHGILHLQGFEDQSRSGRRLMKRREDRLLRALGSRFDFAQLGQ